MNVHVESLPPTPSNSNTGDESGDYNSGTDTEDPSCEKTYTTKDSLDTNPFT